MTRRSVLAVLVLLAVAAGCAPVPQFGPAPTVGPPYIPPPEPVWVVLDPGFYPEPDTTAAPAPQRAPASSPRLPARQPGPDIDPIASGDGATAPPPATSGESIAAAPASRSAGRASGAIAIDLPPADQARLDRAARRNLAAADSLVRLAGPRATAALRREKLETAIGLMAQARDALARGDARAAANLAYKARLLAAESAR